MKTQQEIFDFVAQKLIEQGESSQTTKTCYYRHPEKSLKCAVGHLISDEEYQTDFDNGLSLRRVRRATPSLQGIDLDFLYALQRAHDTASDFDRNSFVSGFKLEMQTVARKYGLDPKEVL